MDFFDSFAPYDYPNHGYVRLPAVTVSDAEKSAVGLGAEATKLEFLTQLARQGFGGLVPKDQYAVYGERVKRELATVDKLGFVDYFLLIWKICQLSDKMGIARDYGRGSAAGSLVFSLIGVTNVDPIKYGLFFERFVSEARAKKKVVDGVTYIDGSLAPDVDLDFDRDRKDEIVAELNKLYPSRICRISTHNTLSGKLLIKECMKIAGGATEDQAKAISDTIPKHFGIVWDIEEAANGKFDEDTGKQESPAVAEFAKWSADNGGVYSLALSLRGLIRNKGTHPSGYVVSFFELDTFLPVEVTEVKDDEDEDVAGKAVSSAFDMETVAKLTVKVDLLSARSCTVVADVLKRIGKTQNDIDITAPVIYEGLQNLMAPTGLFQIEAATNLKVTREIKPKNLSELGDVVAIARPGALSFLPKYVENKAEPIHSLFDPILADTRGVCLYQEQMMQLAHAIGFTLVEAETLRRIVGKKKVDEVQEWKQKIADKVKENGLPVETGDLLWKILKDSAKYSFNRSHSLSFASLTALTCALKFQYPQAYFLALLKHPKVKSRKIKEISEIQDELKHFGIKLLPPDLLKSDLDFTLEGPNIRFGLSSIKGIADKTLIKLQKFRTPHSTRFELFDAAQESGLDISTLCALIQCGCLGEVAAKSSRPSLTLQAQLWSLLTDKERGLARKFGEKFSYNLFEVVRHLTVTNDEKGKPLIKPSRMETIRKKYDPKKAIFEQNSKHEELANYFYENSLLGFSYSAHLRNVFIKYFDNLSSIEEVQNASDGDKVSFVATVVEKPIERTSANKNKYGKWMLRDDTGVVEGLLFNSKMGAKLDEVKAKHDGKLPPEGAIVYAYGTKKGNAVFLDNIVNQHTRIYTKFAELMKDKKEEEEANPVE